MNAITEKPDQTTTLEQIDCPVLVTERLVLRQPVDDDIPDLVRLANNRDVTKMTSSMPHPYTETDGRAFLEKIRSETSRACAYACTLAESGQFIGGAGLSDMGEGPEIGYWLGEPYWGNGYASEIALALTDLAFRATTIDHLVAGCRTDNVASRRILEKNGFMFTHDAIGPSRVAGQVPLFRFRLTREAWMELRSREKR